MCLALALSRQGDQREALAAIDRALAIDPYFFFALLSKAKIYEDMGKPTTAAQTYKNALKVAPPPDKVPVSLKGAYDGAKVKVEAHAHDLAAHLRKETQALREEFNEEDLRRFDECLGILAGVQKRYVHDPILLYFPQLPAIPFYDRSYFPWLTEVEAATDVVRAEYERVYREDNADFAPYIQMPDHAPKNQWADLNKNRAWSSFFLWRDGVRQDENCARCPETAALMDRLPLARQTGYGPTVMFSVLAPHTPIPPHTGSTNTRLIAHLPLVLPGPARFRVGNETREWKMGEAWVFDDSIEHEAWNDADKPRGILIFDVWNPLLSNAERKLVDAMMRALNTYSRDV
jgi:aspartyl/asparaginyl beta-hydroxylase (cupin superfamily)